jgi:hypothetical protein
MALIAAAEGNGAGVALVFLAAGLGLLVVVAPIAWLIGRDANRRGRNGWAWGVLFLWQPVIVGIAYLLVRRRPQGPGGSAP